MSADTIVVRRAEDVVDAVNSGRVSGGNEKAIVLIALGGIFIDAYDFTSLAFGLKDIAEEFALSALAQGVVAASIMVGALVGAIFGGYLVDRVGRYRMFMADMVFFVFAAIGCALAPNVEVLTIFRFLMGLGIGLDFPVALAFLAEFSALKGKGGRVTLWQPMWYVATGSSFIVLLPLYFLLPESIHSELWRFAVGFGAVPALVVLLVRRKYMDESASWAANQGDLERAVGILNSSYGADAVLAPAEELVYPQERPRASLRSFAILFRRRYLGRTIASGLVGMTQSIQYYAVGFFLPFIVGTFLAQGRLSTITVPLLFNFAFGVTGGFAGVRLIGRFGSRGLALSGFAVCLVALLLLGVIGAPDSTLVALLVGLLLGIFVFFHSYGPGAQGMTMATLSYPTYLRGTGSGMGQATLRIGSTISLLLFPILAADLGTGVFYVVAIAPAVGLVTLLLIRWEPIGRDPDVEDADDDAGRRAMEPAGAGR